MNEAQLDRIISTLGFPIFVAVAMFLFFAKIVWPWTTKQVEVAQKQAQDAIQAFGAIKDVLDDHVEQSRKIVAALDKLQRDRR